MSTQEDTIYPGTDTDAIKSPAGQVALRAAIRMVCRECSAGTPLEWRRGVGYHRDRPCPATDIYDLIIGEHQPPSPGYVRPRH